MLHTPPPSPVVAPASSSGTTPEVFDIGDDDMSHEGSEGGILAELPAQALVARENRKAISIAAEAYVHVKNLQSTAHVAIRRHEEEQKTERCRITETARTRRTDRLAAAAEVAVTEMHRTQRQRDALHAQAVREAIVIQGQLEERRIRSGSSTLSLLQWMCASLVGAISASASRPDAAASRLSRAKGRKGLQKLGLSRYLSALILVTFARHLWHNTVSRGILLAWSNSGRNLFGGFTRKMLKGILSTLLQTRRQVREASTLDFAPTQKASDSLVALLSPDQAPDQWVSTKGPDGRIFWHNKALGSAPWELAATIGRLSSGEALKPLMLGLDCSPDCWTSTQGLDGLELLHPKALGSAPWAEDSIAHHFKQLQPCSDAMPIVDEQSANGLHTSVSSSDHLVIKAEPRPSFRSLTSSDHWEVRLKALLSNWGLTNYTDALVQAGYDPDTLRALTSAEVVEMLDAIACRPEDVEVFHKALESWR